MPAIEIFSMLRPRLKFEPGDDSPHWQLILTLITSSVRDRRRSKIIPASLLVEAYCTGIFPMAMENGEIAWFSPDPRGIILLDAFHIPHGLKRVLKKGVFQIRLNTAFEEVIRACGERAETWISEEIIQSYLNLHRLGFAHSVEAGRLQGCVGGIGESLERERLWPARHAICHQPPRHLRGSRNIAVEVYPSAKTGSCAGL
jgi:hypothetical protein